MASVLDISHMIGLGLESNIATATTDKIFCFHRGIKEDIESTKPLLVLIHGYPQSSFMWRHIIPLLPPDIPLFIPDVPGYGRSEPLPGPHDKRSQGEALLYALSALLPPNSRQPIILVGHDRGARICHRLAVDHCYDREEDTKLPILGSIFLDIVPTLNQWETFADPDPSKGSFHWPFLANVEIATSMIMAQGGDTWSRTCLERWVGKSPAGLAKFQEHGAVDVYCDFFKNEQVVRATCDDYRAGAEEDVAEQRSDQEVNNWMEVDALIIYSEGYLGKRYDVKSVWGEWTNKGSEFKLETLGIGGGVGHFIAEEAPEEVAMAIVRFYDEHIEAFAS